MIQTNQFFTLIENLVVNKEINTKNSIISTNEIIEFYSKFELLRD